MKVHRNTAVARWPLAVSSIVELFNISSDTFYGTADLDAIGGVHTMEDLCAIGKTNKLVIVRSRSLIGVRNVAVKDLAPMIEDGVLLHTHKHHLFVRDKRNVISDQCRKYLGVLDEIRLINCSKWRAATHNDYSAIQRIVSEIEWTYGEICEFTGATYDKFMEKVVEDIIAHVIHSTVEEVWSWCKNPVDTPLHEVMKRLDLVAIGDLSELILDYSVPQRTMTFCLDSLLPPETPHEKVDLAVKGLLMFINSFASELVYQKGMRCSHVPIIFEIDPTSTKRMIFTVDGQIYREK